ncbi:hypothetical protein [Mesorhizobium ventifaucium]|uniref:Uncharacterized protein n=1 Tax=Mesorhizobium ventifaucium TaxID=666020 RepID=A0ABM9DTD7_9HYPH|nr:hypothetical protein [Mesorhizobium ventifaucium]CAH2399949.1 hypothetical protein MES4922_230030 [Mesorhizobium ventifaucium]
MMFGTGSTRYLIGSRRAKAKGGGNPMGGPGYDVAWWLPERTFQFTTRADQYTLNMNAKTV